MMPYEDYNPKSNPLFAQARTKDTASSHFAADKATHTLQDDMRTVLNAVRLADGRTAKDLGVMMAYGDSVICGEITLSLIRDIVKLAELPHKKMSKLVGLGFVRIEERAGGNLNWITDAGKAALKCG